MSDAPDTNEHSRIVASPGADPELRRAPGRPVRGGRLPDLLTPPSRPGPPYPGVDQVELHTPSRTISRVSPARLSLMRRARLVDDDEVQLPEHRSAPVLPGRVDALEDGVGRWQLHLQLPKRFHLRVGGPGEAKAKKVTRGDLGHASTAQMTDGQFPTTFCLEGPGRSPLPRPKWL